MSAPAEPEPAPGLHPSVADDAGHRDAERPVDIPYGVRLSAAWAWRAIVVVAAVYLLVRALGRVEVLLVPVLVALLLVALVRPIHVQLSAVPIGSRRFPVGLAALTTLLVTLAVVSGLIAVIGQQVATGFPSLSRQASAGFDELQRWLDRGPLHISDAQLSDYVDNAQEALRSNSDTLVNSALEATSTAGHVLTGFFIVLFSSFFFLSGGRAIWLWVVGLFPRAARRQVDDAGALAWSTLTSFVRATVIVALVDGAGVAIAAAVLGVPLALPLGVLVFLGAFVPIVGAVVTGAVAVLVALVAKGWVVALIMLGAVIAVQQVEAHGLQPFLLGRAVAVHPLGVILAIGTGVILAGIVGALFAVPFVAVANVVTRYLAAGAPEHPLGTAPPPLGDSSGGSDVTESGDLPSTADGAAP